MIYTTIENYYYSVKGVKHWFLSYKEALESIKKDHPFQYLKMQHNPDAYITKVSKRLTIMT